jgi:DNA-binding response OmpR family regulator
VARHANAPAAARTHRFPQRRVLVVDDDPTFALLATQTLEQAAFKVLSASSAQQARSAFATFAPDLVLLDVGLPDGSSFDLCRFIRCRRAGGAGHRAR